MNTAAVVFLYVLISRGDRMDEFRTPHKSYASCHAALELARVKAPSGAENEVAVVMFCGTDLREHYNGQWHQ